MISTRSAIAGVTIGRMRWPDERHVAINLDLPISRRKPRFQRAWQLDAERQRRGQPAFGLWYADEIRRGANWSPVDRLNFLTSWIREEGNRRSASSAIPSSNAGNVESSISRPGKRSGDALTGGNPDLQADKRTVFKLGGYWQPSRMPTFACVPTMSTRTSTGRYQALRSRRRSRPPFPIGSYAVLKALRIVPLGSCSASTCGP